MCDKVKHSSSHRMPTAGRKSQLVVSPTHRTSLSQTSNPGMGLAKTMPSMPGQISSRKEFPKAQRADVQWHLKKQPTV